MVASLSESVVPAAHSNVEQALADPDEAMLWPAPQTVQALDASLSSSVVPAAHSKVEQAPGDAGAVNA